MFCGGEEQPVPGDATFNKEGEGQKLLAPAVRMTMEPNMACYPTNYVRRVSNKGVGKLI